MLVTICRTAAAVAGLAILIGAAAILGSAAVHVLAVPVLLGAAAIWKRRLSRSVSVALLASALSPTIDMPDSVADLRSAWDRSCTLLRDRPPGSARWELAEERRRLLDELELCDPEGFDQWLRAGVHVDDDPAPGHPST